MAEVGALENEKHVPYSKELVDEAKVNYGRVWRITNEKLGFYEPLTEVQKKAVEGKVKEKELQKKRVLTDEEIADITRPYQEVIKEDFYFRKPTNSEFRQILKASGTKDLVFLTNYLPSQLYLCSKSPLPQKDEARLLNITTELLPLVVNGGDTSVKEI